jgi:DNA polymerase-4
MNVLLSKVAKMTESVAFELRQQNKVTGCVVLKLRYSDGDTHTIQRAISYCNTDHVLLGVAKELFRKLFTRRLLVRLLGIRFTNLIPGTYQINLFEDRQATIKLYQAMDHIKKKFGEKVLGRASSQYSD